MIGTRIKPSRETECQYIIQQLNRLGVYENSKGADIEGLNYHALVNLLAVEQAVRE